MRCWRQVRVGAEPSVLAVPDEGRGRSGVRPGEGVRAGVPGRRVRQPAGGVSRPTQTGRLPGASA